jgi:hypothetical protein
MSSINILLKYANDTDLLAPENSDISLSQEFENIKVWAVLNKMVIYFSKTKEIVIYRPNPHHSLCPMPVGNIGQVNKARPLGLILDSKFHFNSHISLFCGSAVSACISLSYCERLTAGSSGLTT